MKHFVYMLRSKEDPDRLYVGSSRDPAKRLMDHNRGSSQYTRRYRPWTMILSVGLDSKNVAGKFERYLKSGAGRAFAKRHFIG